MALIGMAVYSTRDNKKDECLERTLESLYKTTDISRHRIFVSVNSSTDGTKNILRKYFGCKLITCVIVNDTNLGTAEAINKVWKQRKPWENAIKMDDDVVIHNNGWADEMEEAISRDPSIGICGLKRKDCIETPYRDDWYKSELYMLPHEPGQRWIIAEQVNHVMGTCQMYSSELLDKIGFLYQMPGNKYGFDDSLAAARCRQAGFKNVFLPHIEIDHIDHGGTPYQQWKEKNAGEHFVEYNQTVLQYTTGERSIYYNPFIT